MKHPKSRPFTRTMHHGQRLTPQYKIVEFLRIPAEKVVGRAKKILVDGQVLDEKDLFLLTQMVIAAERQLLPKECEKKKEELRQELEKREYEGEKLGFPVEDIRGMNAAIFLIANDQWLSSFYEQARKRIKSEKEEK